MDVQRLLAYLQLPEAHREPDLGKEPACASLPFPETSPPDSGIVAVILLLTQFRSPKIHARVATRSEKREPVPTPCQPGQHVHRR